MKLEFICLAALALVSCSGQKADKEQSAAPVAQENVQEEVVRNQLTEQEKALLQMISLMIHGSWKGQAIIDLNHPTRDISITIH